MLIAELQQNSLLREDMTDDNLADFLSSTYNKDKNNVTFQRLNKLMFVEIPLVLCGGDNGLTQLSDNSATWENYAQHYTYGLEALVILMFETQLRYLTGEVSNDPQDLETVLHSDTSMLSDGVKKRREADPKTNRAFALKSTLHARPMFKIAELRHQNGLVGMEWRCSQLLTTINQSWID
jgi:hypothetical protein